MRRLIDKLVCKIFGHAWVYEASYHFFFKEEGWGPTYFAFRQCYRCMEKEFSIANLRGLKPIQSVWLRTTRTAKEILDDIRESDPGRIIKL